METLTKKEEEIMQILWNLKKGFVKDVIEHLEDDPKPPYNTISSLVRQLEKKGFVGYTAYGKTYEYYPLISKMAYRKHLFTRFISDYFENSYQNVVSYMVTDKELSDDDVSELKRIIETSDKHKSDA